VRYRLGREINEAVGYLFIKSWWLKKIRRASLCREMSLTGEGYRPRFMDVFM
jgi:hypothetical protein